MVSKPSMVLWHASFPMTESDNSSSLTPTSKWTLGVWNPPSKSPCPAAVCSPRWLGEETCWTMMYLSALRKVSERVRMTPSDLERVNYPSVPWWCHPAGGCGGTHLLNPGVTWLGWETLLSATHMANVRLKVRTEQKPGKVLMWCPRG